MAKKKMKPPVIFVKASPALKLRVTRAAGVLESDIYEFTRSAMVEKLEEVEGRFPELRSPHKEPAAA